MRKLFVTTLIVATSFTLKAQNSSVQDYINQYKEIAVNEMVRTGVPASITLAQGILESGSGNSKLAMYSNNHFGIKCKTEWTGGTVYQDDDIKNECFRVYKTSAESYKDHSDFLKNRPYYTALFNLDPTDYKGWAKGLKKAGYATERDYPKNLITLIEKYNLEQYSEEGIARIKKSDDRFTDLAVQKNKDNNATAQQAIYTESGETSKNSDIALFGADKAETSNTEKRIENHPKTQTSEAIAITDNVNYTTLSASSYPKQVFKINRTKVLYVAKGTSLFALASNQNMSFHKILDYNDLPEGTDILSKDRLVYLEKKPKKGEKDIHLVANGESLDEIAQKEGVQLSSLAIYNHIEPESLPLAGENIFLRKTSPNAPQLIPSKSLALH